MLRLRRLLLQRSAAKPYGELIDALIRTQNVNEAWSTLRGMVQEGVKAEPGLYNQIAQGWVNTRQGERALGLLRIMKLDGVQPNVKTYSVALQAALQASMPEAAQEVLNEAVYERKMHALEFLKHTQISSTLLAGQKRRSYVDPMPFVAVTTAGSDDDAALLFGKEAGEPSSTRTSSRYKRQVELETRAVDMAVARYRRELHETTQLGKGAEFRPAMRMMLGWYGPLVESLKQEQDLVEKRVTGVDRNVYGPYLLMLSPEKLAVITIHEILGMLLVQPEGIPLTLAAATIGAHVETEVSFKRLQMEKHGVWKAMQKSATPRTVHQKAAELFDHEWGAKIRVKVGSALIDHLLRTCVLMTDNKGGGGGGGGGGELAFNHIYALKDSRRTGMIVARDEVFARIEEGHGLRESLHTRHLPMVVPPRPWTSPRSGGYLSVRMPIMRTRGSEMQMALLMENKDKLGKLYRALNVLGKTAWRVNEGVLKVVLDAWENDDGVGDLPSRKDLPLPQPPRDFEMDVSVRRKWRKEYYRTKQLNQDLHGLRCDTMNKLAIAKEFVNDVLYFPMNIDFRGRCYPIPPHLNHIGSDMCRGLLTFHKRERLGPRGLYWLKIHVANLVGECKGSTFEERLAWTSDRQHLVRDAALKPLDGSRWWLKADDPWQTLAACRELHAASQLRNPEDYESSLPLHVDGSCNGLQHFAALGGDELGARSVNLIPEARPQDVYQGVADIVAKLVAEDKKTPIARKLDGIVSRQTIKQTVMTYVYGVTFIGAREQIRNSLKDELQLSDDDRFTAASYLARLTFQALKTMFLGARQIQDWLTESARLIALSSGQPVVWTTPLGLECVQPYRRVSSQQVRTLVQTVVLADHSDQLPVSVARQKSAFAPNYVHSLDSSHMFNTALACNNDNIQFSSVHDSFWTHAAHVDILNNHLRVQFYNLHKQPLLRRLHDQFQQQHPDIQFPDLPERGSLDLAQVLDSPYFFH